jgi:hypothetical protein
MVSVQHTLHVDDFARRVAQIYLQGKAEGMTRSLLGLLGLLGLEVSAAERATILATTDLATIDAWFDRVPTAPSTAAVLGPRRSGPRRAALRPRRRVPSVDK